MFGLRRVDSSQPNSCAAVFAVGDVYIKGVAINDIYNCESFFVVFFKIANPHLFAGLRLSLPLTPDTTVVEPDENGYQQQAQNEYSRTPTSAHRIMVHSSKFEVRFTSHKSLTASFLDRFVQFEGGTNGLKGLFALVFIYNATDSDFAGGN